MKKSNQKSLRKLVIGCVVLFLAIGIGYLLRDRLFHPLTSSIIAQQPNWYIAIPFMLILAGFVVMGYLTEWRIRK